MKIKGKIIGPNVVISKDSFEYILLCMCSQKFVDELPPNGDAMELASKNPKKYKNIQKETQKTIDDCWRDAMDLLHGTKSN